MTATVKPGAWGAPGALAAVLALAACVTEEPAVTLVKPGAPAVPAGWTPVLYSCDGSQTLRASFSPDGEAATIEQMDEVIRMKLVPSASGARYQAVSQYYTYSLDTKGKTATLYEGDSKPVLSNCVSR